MKKNETSATRELIPRVMHRIWFGDRPIPAQYEQYWAAWQRQYPDFEFRTWREADIAGFRTAGAIERAEGMARKADIARYEILLTQGGIYLDCDIFPLYRFAYDLLENELVVCNEIEADHYCSIGFIAAAPGGTALAWAVETLQHRELNRLPPNEDTGPWLFRQALAHGPYKKLPTKAFYPYLFNEPFAAIFERDLSGTFGVHVWGGSWLSEQQKRGKIADRLKRGDLQEAAQLAADGASDEGRAVGEFCDAAKEARIKALAAANHQILSNRLKIDNRAPLDFVKAGLFLLSQVPDALIWQIGAADGILVDPLRALLVNFDPPAVLLEPNPYLHDMLVANYRNNQQAKLINAALCETGEKLVLNAINPAKVRERGLPEWALGISSAFNDRNAIGGLTIDAETARRIGECLERIEAEVVDVEFLLALHGGTHPALVVIDVEGMDAQMVKLIMEKGIKPFILQFERQCLPEAELKIVGDLLGAEYVTIAAGNDVIAYRVDFFSTYCEHLFVENGIHTVYRDALKFVFNLG